MTLTMGTWHGLETLATRLTAQRVTVQKQIKAIEARIGRTVKPKNEPLEMRTTTKRWVEKTPSGEKVWCLGSVQGTDTHALRKQRVALKALSRSLSNRLRKIHQVVP